MFDGLHLGSFSVIYHKLWWLGRPHPILDSHRRNWQGADWIWLVVNNFSCRCRSIWNYGTIKKMMQSSGQYRRWRFQTAPRQSFFFLCYACLLFEWMCFNLKTMRIQQTLVLLHAEVIHDEGCWNKQFWFLLAKQVPIFIKKRGFCATWRYACD